MDGKIEQHVCIKFYVKLCKSTTETCPMLCEAFGECFLTWAVVLNGIHVSRPVECLLKLTPSGQPSTSKRTENVDKIRELIHKDSC
jgi:hypothetical protein